MADHHNFPSTVPALFAAHEKRYQEAQELIKKLQAELVQLKCSRCDGTGDVHRADGEWMGTCSSQVSRWKPIESAPPRGHFIVIAKDVRPFRGALKLYTSDPYCVFRIVGHEEFCRWPHPFAPTHWMPVDPI